MKLIELGYKSLQLMLDLVEGIMFGETIAAKDKSNAEW